MASQRVATTNAFSSIAVDWRRRRRRSSSPTFVALPTANRVECFTASWCLYDATQRNGTGMDGHKRYEGQTRIIEGNRGKGKKLYGRFLGWLLDAIAFEFGFGWVGFGDSESVRSRRLCCACRCLWYHVGSCAVCCVLCEAAKAAGAAATELTVPSSRQAPVVAHKITCPADGQLEWISPDLLDLTVSLAFTNR